MTAIVLEVPNDLIGTGTVHAWAAVSLFGHAPEAQLSRPGLPLLTHFYITDIAVLLTVVISQRNTIAPPPAPAPMTTASVTRPGDRG